MIGRISKYIAVTLTIIALVSYCITLIPTVANFLAYEFGKVLGHLGVLTIDEILENSRQTTLEVIQSRPIEDAKAEELRELLEEFDLKSRRELLVLQVSERLCITFGCKVVDEELASQTVAIALEEREISEAQVAQLESRWLNRFSLLLTAIGVLIAYWALRHSKDADMRSVRNEIEIDRLKTSDEAMSEERA